MLLSTMSTDKVVEKKLRAACSSTRAACLSGACHRAACLSRVHLPLGAVRICSSAHEIGRSCQADRRYPPVPKPSRRKSSRVQVEAEGIVTRVADSSPQKVAAGCRKCGDFETHGNSQEAS